MKPKGKWTLPHSAFDGYFEIPIEVGPKGYKKFLEKTIQLIELYSDVIIGDDPKLNEIDFQI